MKVMLVVAVLIALTPSLSRTQSIVSYKESYEGCKTRVENNIKILEDAGYVFTKKQKKCKVKYQCTGIPCRLVNK